MRKRDPNRPLSKREFALALRKLRIIGRGVVKKQADELADLAEYVATFLHRDIPVTAPDQRVMVREFIGHGESSAQAWTDCDELKRPCWKSFIDPKRLTNHIPSLVAGRRVFPDGREV